MAKKRERQTPGRDSPRVGFHVSIEGGLPRAVERALERDCTALQVFCDNPRGWATASRPAEQIEAFRDRRREADLAPLVVHACYLINPCAPDRTVFERSVRRLAHELQVSARIGAEFYVLHPGSHKGKPTAWGVQRAARAIARAAERAGPSPCLLLENTASAHGPGGSFEGLGDLMAALRTASPDLEVGIALDSCHAFAAGYDLRDAAGVERLVEDIATTVGPESVRLIHANDARDPCGSGRDRHWHIGKGEIGRTGLRNMLRHPALDGLPAILETPWESLAVDRRNMRALRRLLQD